MNTSRATASKGSPTFKKPSPWLRGIWKPIFPWAPSMPPRGIGFGPSKSMTGASRRRRSVPTARRAGNCRRRGTVSRGGSAHEEGRPARRGCAPSGRPGGLDGAVLGPAAVRFSRFGLFIFPGAGDYRPEGLGPSPVPAFVGGPAGGVVGAGQSREPAHAPGTREFGRVLAGPGGGLFPGGILVGPVLVVRDRDDSSGIFPGILGRRPAAGSLRRGRRVRLGGLRLAGGEASRPARASAMPWPGRLRAWRRASTSRAWPWSRRRRRGARRIGVPAAGPGSWGAFAGAFALVLLGAYALFMGVGWGSLEAAGRTDPAELFLKVEQSPLSSLYTSRNLAKQFSDWSNTVSVQGGPALLAFGALSALLLAGRWGSCRAAGK